MKKLPTYFISHGGGPWPYVPQMRNQLKVLEQSLADIPRQIGVTPTAILMVSGHWEEAGFSVMASARPTMLYDYGGFPEHTYHVIYGAPGAPELALRIHDLIKAAGLPTQLDHDRGFDHGTFSPLAVMYSDADVPVLQVALKEGLDPAIHLALGRALAPLRDEGVLIIGSGLSYHNLRAMGAAGAEPSKAFDVWLQKILISAPPAERRAQLLAWEQAPAARMSHPREEHLLPLMVAVGAAELEPAACVYHETTFTGSVVASSFRFGATEGLEPL